MWPFRRREEELDFDLVEQYVRMTGPSGYRLALALESLYGGRVANERLRQGIEMRQAQAEGRFARKVA